MVCLQLMDAIVPTIICLLFQWNCAKTANFGPVNSMHYWLLRASALIHTGTKVCMHVHTNAAGQKACEIR